MEKRFHITEDAIRCVRSEACSQKKGTGVCAASPPKLNKKHRMQRGKWMKKLFEK